MEALRETKASMTAVGTSLIRFVIGAVLALPLAGCSQSPEKPPTSTQPSPNAPAAYRGSLDGISGDYIIGWAWDPDHPNDAVMVALYDGDSLLGTVKAETARKDLADSRIGTGKYGFALTIPKELRDGKAHQLHARLKGTNTDLVGSPRSVTAESLGSGSAGK